MHHIVLERWSKGSTAVHRIDPRAKIIPLLVLLTALATAQRGLGWLAAAFFLLLCVGFLAARLPLGGALTRAAVVLPFTCTFALISWVGGDPARGTALILKSYVSSLAVILVVATTPLPTLLRGLELLRVPLFLLTVIQFLYRYLFVISEEGQHMRKAAAARGADTRVVRFAGSRFQAAAGAVAVLFARSYERAESVHRAMLSRGYEGHLLPLMPLRFRKADAAFLAFASAAAIAVRLTLETMA